MAKIIVAELEGAQLDYWVGVAEGKFERRSGEGIVHYYLYFPSSEWAIGGPIIEQEKIWLSDEDGNWIASYPPHVNDAIFTGPTMLIAAMRSYVALKFGAEFDDGEG